MDGNPRQPTQLPLELGIPVRLSREDLIVGRSNAAAVDLVDRWPDWTAPVMVVAGPPGTGKSHLAAVWRAESGAFEAHASEIGPKVLEQAAAGPVLIDDCDRLPIDENGLFHLINAIRGAGTHLLLTARRFPAAWPVALPDLASRLKAAQLVEIDEPDDALLVAVMAKLFADRQVEVEPHVLDYVARRIERSLSTAIDVVDRLDRAALARKARISRGLASEVLSEADAGQAKLDL